VRVSYLQPAEMRPDLVTGIGSTPGVARYFDLSFQHASGAVLRRMRRFGDGQAFLELIDRIRAVAPTAGIRSNFIVGFPQETQADVDELCNFLIAARLDAIGVFGYSDEDGTAAVDLPGHLDDDEVAARVAHVAALADTLMVQRAEERLGEVTTMLVERIVDGAAEGRCEHQGPDDATTLVADGAGLSVGDLVEVRIVADDGVDLVAVAT
jgi:tRNA A37 methylthiotransferase MiaB